MSSVEDKENSGATAVASTVVDSPRAKSASGAAKPAIPYEAHNYVGPYRLEKTLGKGQTGRH